MDFGRLNFDGFKEDSDVYGARQEYYLRSDFGVDDKSTEKLLTVEVIESPISPEDAIRNAANSVMKQTKKGFIKNLNNVQNPEEIYKDTLVPILTKKIQNQKDGISMNSFKQETSNYNNNLNNNNNNNNSSALNNNNSNENNLSNYGNYDGNKSIDNNGAGGNNNSNINDQEMKFWHSTEFVKNTLKEIGNLTFPEEIHRLTAQNKFQNGISSIVRHMISSGQINSTSPASNSIGGTLNSQIKESQIAKKRKLKDTLNENMRRFVGEAKKLREDIIKEAISNKLLEYHKLPPKIQQEFVYMFPSNVVQQHQKLPMLSASSQKYKQTSMSAAPSTTKMTTMSAASAFSGQQNFNKEEADDAEIISLAKTVQNSNLPSQYRPSTGILTNAEIKRTIKENKNIVKTIGNVLEHAISQNPNEKQISDNQVNENNNNPRNNNFDEKYGGSGVNSGLNNNYSGNNFHQRRPKTVASSFAKANKQSTTNCAVSGIKLPRPKANIIGNPLLPPTSASYNQSQQFQKIGANINSTINRNLNGCNANTLSPESNQSAGNFCHSNSSSKLTLKGMNKSEKNSFYWNDEDPLNNVRQKGIDQLGDLENIAQTDFDYSRLRAQFETPRDEAEDEDNSNNSSNQRNSNNNSNNSKNYNPFSTNHSSSMYPSSSNSNNNNNNNNKTRINDRNKSSNNNNNNDNNNEDGQNSKSKSNYITQADQKDLATLNGYNFDDDKGAKGIADEVHNKLQKIWDNLGFSFQQKIQMVIKYSATTEASERLSDSVKFWEIAEKCFIRYNAAYRASKDYMRFEFVSIENRFQVLSQLESELKEAENNMLDISEQMKKNFNDDMIVKRRGVKELVMGRRYKLKMLKKTIGLETEEK